MSGSIYSFCRNVQLVFSYLLGLNFCLSDLLLKPEPGDNKFYIIQNKGIGSFDLFFVFLT